MLFIIAMIWKPPKCPLINKWVKKWWQMYTMECYSVIEKNEISPFATAWTELEVIMLNEISQTKTNTI